MSDTRVQIARVVVAYPGDTQAEAEAIAGVIDEVNRSVGADRGVRLEAVTWRTHAFPGLHDEGPQGLIDPLLHIAECEVLLAIFWKHFGTPTMQAQSGTEHEIRAACRMWKDRAVRGDGLFQPGRLHTKIQRRAAVGQVLQSRTSSPRRLVVGLRRARAVKNLRVGT